VFERFTERARHAVGLAQVQARELGHDHVGTEHLLLALLRDDECLAARVLASFEVTLDRVRAEVIRRVPAGREAPGSQIPFTPRAKKALELSLQQVLKLGHDYVDTEHLLLGLADTDDGDGAAVLRDLGIDLGELREAVIREAPARVGQRWRGGPRRLRQRPPAAGPMPEVGFRVEPDPELLNLLMLAGAQALEDGRTAITVDDVRTALARRTGEEPPEAAAGR
jgi:ATP-dependent Clp protease ATP-binding subunit ClpA